MAMVKIHTLAALVLSIGALAAMSAARAADLFVIANSSLALAADEVKDVYLGEKQITGSTKIVPIDNTALQKDFLDKVIKLDAVKYGSMWTKKGFRDGLTAPAIKSSDAEVLAAVKTTPGAVGYVSAAPAGVNVIQKY
jgi:hypothetical protein